MVGYKDDISKIKKKDKKHIGWMFIGTIYLLVLFSTAYVSFSGEHFNNSDELITTLTDLRSKNILKDEDIEIFTNIMLEKQKSNEKIQELASQSFNITLGALLAFLAGSATVLFQKIKVDTEEV